MLRPISLVRDNTRGKNAQLCSRKVLREAGAPSVKAGPPFKKHLKDGPASLYVFSADSVCLIEVLRPVDF